MEDKLLCQDLVSSLSEYVDGELKGELCEELEKHLEHCHNCQVVVNTLKKTIELYRDSSDYDQMPDPARKELYARLKIEDFIHN